MELTLRLMSEADQPAIMAIQQDAYEPRFQEDWDKLLDKLQLHPAGCWVCSVGDEVVAYLFSHPSGYSSPPALNRGMEKLPDSPDCYYIHDLSMLKARQGQGIGRLLGAKAVELAIADRFPQMALIAVQRSEDFWSKLGFRPAEVSPEIAAKLRTYSEDAIYMRRGLPNE